MSALCSVLDALSSEADAEVDAEQSLARLNTLLKEGGSERDAFLRGRGFETTMSFFGDAYGKLCGDVLLSALDRTPTTAWPDWLPLRLLGNIRSTQTTPPLKESDDDACLDVLLRGAKRSPRVCSSIKAKKSDGGSVMKELVAEFLRVHLTAWSDEGFEAVVSLTEMYLSEADVGDLCHGIDVLFAALRNARLHTVDANQLLEARTSSRCLLLRIAAQARLQKAPGAEIRRQEIKLARSCRLIGQLTSVLESDRRWSDPFERGSLSVTAAAVLTDLRELTAASPTKVQRVLDWKGNLKAFEVRRVGLRTLEGTSVVEEWTKVARALARSGAVARLLHQSDAIGWLDELCRFGDDRLKELAVPLYGSLAALCTGARSDVLDSASVYGLCGMANAGPLTCALNGLEGLAGALDRAPGETYLWYESSALGLQKVLELYAQCESDASRLKRSCREVIQRCLERSRRMQGTAWPRLPSRAPWTAYRSVLDPNFVRPAPADSRPPSEPQNRKAGPAVAEAAADRGFDEDGVRVAFDSGPSEETKKIRAAWKSLPLQDKVRWTQTAEDVLVWIALPEGTKARGVNVDVEPERLSLRLDWFGRVVDGPLHRRCKASESLWVLEGSECHITLPKDDQHFWKSLFEGGVEKSFFELLQESVESDEPVPSYDSMDLRSKELIEEIRERQAMIGEGLIDVEGFDDFRIVVGEQSL